jgi:hypothetical protein
MARYAVKIQELLAKMFALRLHVLPANRGSVNKYLDSIYNGVTTLHSGLNACYINESLQEKFHSYVEAEEARLRGNLEAISYDIDALNTLYLISGQGRIERVGLSFFTADLTRLIGHIVPVTAHFPPAGKGLEDSEDMSDQGGVS